MLGVKSISPYQFAFFRIVLGTYLAWHFVGLVPYATELFSNEGLLADAGLNLTYGLFPNPLWLWDSPAMALGTVWVGILAAVAFAVGAWRRAAAVVLWFVWACLFHRNNLISNPGLPYVGLILLLSATVPAGEKLSLRRRAEGWAFPAMSYWTAWLLLMAGYTYSGIVKLASPSWVDGSALRHLMLNPLARDTATRDFALGLPEGLLRCATWLALAIEVFALPLAFSKRTRPWIWLALVGLHLSILSVVDFADLTLGMLMVHLFTFDPDWLPARPSQAGKHLVLYDGVCGLCDRTVQFLLEEDRGSVLTFAQLQGETGQATLERFDVAKDMQTLVFVRDWGSDQEQVTLRSTAVLNILANVGGFWRAVSWLRVIPRSVRDLVYKTVSTHRYKWFGRFDACKIPTPESRARFLD